MPDYFYVLTTKWQTPRGTQDSSRVGIYPAKDTDTRASIFTEIMRTTPDPVPGRQGEIPVVSFWSLEENEFEPIEDMAAVDQDEASL